MSAGFSVTLFTTSREEDMGDGREVDTVRNRDDSDTQLAMKQSLNTYIGP